MASKLITDAVNPRKLLSDKKARRDAGKPLKFDDKGNMVPPSQEELELQLAIVQCFNSSNASQPSNSDKAIQLADC